MKLKDPVREQNFGFHSFILLCSFR
uniref:Uncharacterized protein n=1 Tax=Rhizophora mucronata TaxID=61149 RepID=A0A2P2PEB2_RHIMU